MVTLFKDFKEFLDDLNSALFKANGDFNDFIDIVYRTMDIYEVFDNKDLNEILEAHFPNVAEILDLNELETKFCIYNKKSIYTQNAARILFQRGLIDEETERIHRKK